MKGFNLRSLNESIGSELLSFAGVNELNIEEAYTNDGRSLWQGERGLMSALLFDGIQNYLNYFSCTQSNKNKFKEAMLWVNQRGGEYIFSFDNVCEALDIKPEYLRAGLANLVSSNLTDIKRMRKTF